MIAGLFLNPAFLLVAIALVSVPIIIHLINRMRFKRIRWGAMEFLLKAQKRTRRRLIIEQLLLLALRCTLIGLLGFLVLHFVGCGDADFGGKPSLHLVLLDDTLSMQDQIKGADGSARTCFEVAKNDFLIKKIARGLGQSKTNDRLLVLPLSKLNDPKFAPKEVKTYERLNDTQKMKELVQDVAEMQPSALHVSMLEGVKAAQTHMSGYAESGVTLHLLTDFRHSDWAHPAGEGLTKELLEMVKKNKDIKIRLIDTALPARAATQGDYPPSNDNVGIVDFRPDTRIAGHKMPVRFTVSIANYSGKQVEVSLTARNEDTGKDMLQVDFDMVKAKEDKSRIRLSPESVTDVTFDFGDIKHDLFFPDLKQGESRFAHLSVRLTNAQKRPLGNDGLLGDNIRYTVVEVRDKVPILVIDGDGPRGRAESKDSFILERTVLCYAFNIEGVQRIAGDFLHVFHKTTARPAIVRVVDAGIYAVNPGDVPQAVWVPFRVQHGLVIISQNPVFDLLQHVLLLGRRNLCHHANGRRSAGSAVDFLFCF